MRKATGWLGSRTNRLGGRRWWLAALSLCVAIGGFFATNATVRAAEPDQACLAYCAAIEASCSKHARQVARACARDAATGGVDPFTQRRNTATGFCGYFLDVGHCMPGLGQGACIERFRQRHTLCTEAYLTNTASEHLQCNEAERAAMQICREDLGVCEAGC